LTHNTIQNIWCAKKQRKPVLS